MLLLYDRIRFYREKKGLTQRQLDEAAGVAHCTVWQLETGNNANPKIMTLFKIANALDVGLAALIRQSKPIIANIQSDHKKLSNDIMEHVQALSLSEKIALHRLLDKKTLFKP